MRIRYGIKSPFVPGVATADSPGAKRTAFEHAVNHDGLFGIARAAWLKTAGLPKKRAEYKAIGLNKIDNYCLHRFIALGQSGCNCGMMVSNAIADSGALATITKSCAPSDEFCSRKSSLICRLMRLRTTAFLLTFLETTRPSRGWPVVFFAT